MEIKKWYEITEKFGRRWGENLLYKMGKLIVNIWYPSFTKPIYGLNPEGEVIVSLTSFPDRISKVWITILTLLRQTYKPKKIILWLAEEQFPQKEGDLPRKLLELQKFGLEIMFCDNLLPHKKYYFTMQQYPNDIVVTVDDDVFYPENLIEKLMSASKKFPGVICCSWAHEITLNKDGIRNYSDWKLCIESTDKPSMLVMPVGCGGVLYPPNVLHEEVFNINAIKKLCICTDDLWLKAMEVRKGTKAIRYGFENKRTFYTIISSQRNSLNKENVGNNKNDEALKYILSVYKDVEEILHYEEKNS